MAATDTSVPARKLLRLSGAASPVVIPDSNKYSVFLIQVDGAAAAANTTTINGRVFGGAATPQPIPADLQGGNILGEAIGWVSLPATMPGGIELELTSPGAFNIYVVMSKSAHSSPVYTAGGAR